MKYKTSELTCKKIKILAIQKGIMIRKYFTRSEELIEFVAFFLEKDIIIMIKKRGISISQIHTISIKKFLSINPLTKMNAT